MVLADVRSRLLSLIAVLVLLPLATRAVADAQVGWPRQIDVTGGRISFDPHAILTGLLKPDVQHAGAAE